jgi:hypothetical protein
MQAASLEIEAAGHSQAAAGSMRIENFRIGVQLEGTQFSIPNCRRVTSGNS